MTDERANGSPWDDPSIPDELDARRVYEFAIATGGSRRRRRRHRVVVGSAIALAFALGIPLTVAATDRAQDEVVVSGQPSTTVDSTRPPRHQTSTTIKGVVPDTPTTDGRRADRGPNVPAPGRQSNPSDPSDDPARPEPPVTTPRTTPAVVTPTTRATTVTTPPVTPTQLAFVGGNKNMVCAASGCSAPASGNDSKITITSRQWSAVDSFCLDFTFTGDLLDHNEWFLSKTPAGAYGVVVVSNTATTTSTFHWCASAGDLNAAGPALRAGSYTVDFFMAYGSVTIADIDVTITGTPA